MLKCEPEVLKEKAEELEQGVGGQELCLLAVNCGPPFVGADVYGISGFPCCL